MTISHITITEEEGEGIKIEGGGTFTPGDQSIVEKLTVAAINGIKAEMDRLQGAGEYYAPIVEADPRMNTNFTNDKYDWWRF